LPNCTSFNSNKEGTNEKASSASEEDALFASNGVEGCFQRPKAAQDGSCWTPELARLSLPRRRSILLSYFLALEQCSSLTTFQQKHQHKPNFSIRLFFFFSSKLN
jgi:hypothetical protein